MGNTQPHLAPRGPTRLSPTILTNATFLVPSDIDWAVYGDKNHDCDGLGRILIGQQLDQDIKANGNVWTIRSTERKWLVQGTLSRIVLRISCSHAICQKQHTTDGSRPNQHCSRTVHLKGTLQLISKAWSQR